MRRRYVGFVGSCRVGIAAGVPAGRGFEACRGLRCYHGIQHCRKTTGVTPDEPVRLLLAEIRHNPLLWLLVFVPVVFVGSRAQRPKRTRWRSCSSVLAIVPLAALLSHATESVAAKTGDSVGGLLNATLGNLTELVIALTALRAGQYMLVKASLAGAIVTNSLFMLGASFLLGGLKYHTQEYNRVSARLQAGLLFLATVALLGPVRGRRGRCLGTGGVHAGVEPGPLRPAHRRLRAWACCSR